MNTDVTRTRRIIDRRKWEALRERLKQSLSARFYLRLHMTLILAIAWLGGVVAAWTMKHFGLTDLTWRYALAVLVAYGVFVAGVTLWVHILRGRRGSDADANIDDPGLTDIATSNSDADSGSDSVSLLDLAGADGEGVVVVIVVIAAAAVAVGGGVYLIWEAPAIAVEGVLEIILATGMLRVRGVEPHGGVARFVLKRTWWIALLAVIAALGVAYLRSWSA